MKNLLVGVKYSIQVEYRTMFGVVGQSNIIEVVQENTPITVTEMDSVSDLDAQAQVTTKIFTSQAQVVNEVDYDDYSDFDDVIPPEVVDAVAEKTVAGELDDGKRDSETTIDNLDHYYDDYDKAETPG